MKTKIVCKECGSEDVEAKVWYNLLREEASIEYLSDIENEDTWCLECQGHTGIRVEHFEDDETNF